MLSQDEFGFSDVYNLLPEHVVEQKSAEVSGFEWRRLLASHLLAACPSVRASVASFFLRHRLASILAVALQSLLVACGLFVEDKAEFGFS